MKRGFILFWLLLPAMVVWGQNGNILDNPDFDADIDHWTPISDAQISWQPGIDIDSNPVSGSMLIIQVQDDTNSAQVWSDCFLIEGGYEYSFGGWFYIDGTQPGDPGIVILARSFSSTNCEGAAIDTPGTNNIAFTDEWFLKSTSFRLFSDEANSARLIINTFNNTNDEFFVYADSMYFSSSTLFRDGFESRGARGVLPANVSPDSHKKPRTGRGFLLEPDSS